MECMLYVNVNHMVVLAAFVWIFPLVVLGKFKLHQYMLSYISYCLLSWSCSRLSEAVTNRSYISWVGPSVGANFFPFIFQPFAEAAVVMDFVHVPTCVLVQVDKSRQIVDQNPVSVQNVSYKLLFHIPADHCNSRVNIYRFFK